MTGHLLVGAEGAHPFETLSREVGGEALAWRDEFLDGGKDALKGRRGQPTDPDERRLREAEHKVGELTLENEILKAAA